ncbi:MAG TPA: hypothetical protein P5077_07825 [bacterium]|nr:hypothetical protein [bacterium]
MKHFTIFAVFSLFCFCLFPQEKQLKVAVMEIEDKSGQLSKETIENAAEYIRSSLASTNKYVLISKDRQQKVLVKEMKKESWKECYDQTCRIQLGQALTADTILVVLTTKFGGSFIISVEMIDLAKEATVRAAKADFDGTEDSMRKVIDVIVRQLVGDIDVALSMSTEIKPAENSDSLRKGDMIKLPPKLENDLELLNYGKINLNVKINPNIDFDPEHIDYAGNNIPYDIKREMDYFNNETVKRLTKKAELLVELEKAYLHIMKNSKYLDVKAEMLTRIAILYTDIYEKMVQAPIPPWLNSRQEQVYRDMIVKKGTNARTKALDAFRKVLDLGPSVSSEWRDYAQNEISRNEVDEDEYVKPSSGGCACNGPVI